MVGGGEWYSIIIISVEVPTSGSTVVIKFYNSVESLTSLSRVNVSVNNIYIIILIIIKPYKLFYQSLS